MGRIFIRNRSESFALLVNWNEGREGIWAIKLPTIIPTLQEMDLLLHFKSLPLFNAIHYFYSQPLMSEEQLKAFIAKVQVDKSLQEKLNAEGADPLAIGKEAGFSITSDD